LKILKIGSEQPKIFSHISIHSIVPVIIASVPCFDLSTVLLQKESCGYAKVKNLKKERDGQVSKIKKREKNKIAHDL
jgi:hypothetical protein